jgi:cytidylate kinase
MPGVVTISATYGAAGSVIAPRLAERLALPFLDRLISVDIAHEVACSESLHDEERTATPTSRLLLYLARLPSVLGTPIPDLEELDRGERLRRDSDAALDELASTTGGVVLGRAASVVLAERPNVLHVRLDGPSERRWRRATTIEGIDEATARQRQSETDRARAVYVRRLYGRDAADLSLYHMLLDSTLLSIDACVETLAAAATAFWAQSSGGRTG